MFRPTAKLVITLAILCLGGVSLVLAQTSVPWSMTLHATDGTNNATVTIGAAAGASDGFDSLFDAAAPPAPPPPSVQVVAHITDPSPYRQSLSRDMRSATQDSVVYELYRDGDDDNITITWTLPSGFAPMEMKYGFHFGTAAPTSYTSMLSAPYSLTMEPGVRVRIIYKKSAGVDSLPPIVGTLNPAEGNRGPCSTMVSCDITDFSGVDGSSITMTIAGTPIPWVNLTLSTITGGFHVLSPMQYFADSQSVQVCVTAADASGLHNAMRAPFCWVFTARCGGGPDLIPPYVLNPYPADGATGVSPVTGHISAWIEDYQSGVNLSSVVMTFDGLPVIPASVTPTASGYMLTYNYSGLVSYQDYTFCLRGCDQAPTPNCVTDQCYTFTTGGTVDTCIAFNKTVRVYDQNGVGAHNVLTFGTNLMASDGFNAGLDVNVPVIFPGTFQSFFPLGTDTLSPNYHLTSDIRSCQIPNITWKIKAVSVTGTWSVQWSSVDFFDPTLPVGSTFKIGVSDNEFVPPDVSALIVMRDGSSIMSINPGQVVWITYMGSGECTPPELRNQSPAAGETDVCLTDTIRFDVVDPENQVDRSSIHVWLAGEEITSRCLFEALSGGAGYRVIFAQANMFPSVNTEVRVTADNMCIPAVGIDQTYAFMTGTSACASEWTSNLTVNGVIGADTSRVQLYFGIAALGTDGYDDSLDGIAPPPPPSGLDRYFSITASRPEFERLLRDIRSNSDTLIVWKIAYGTDEESFSPLWVSWDQTVINTQLPPGTCELSIWQNFGSTVGEPPVQDNIHSTSSFTFDPGAFLYIRYRPFTAVPRHLSGTVTVEDHTDFSGTAIHITNSLGSLSYDVVTDASGAFAWTNLQSDCWHLTATRDSFVTWDTTICLTSGDVVANHEMMWPRYAFCGTVTLIGEASNAGATVNVDGRLSATSDAGGAFSINVPFNGLSHAVVVSKPRFSTAYDTVVVPEGAPCDHNYTLNRTCFGLSGTVTSGGTGVAGVVVTTNGLSATTDGTGHYSLDSCLTDGGYSATATISCYDPATLPFTISGAAAVLDFSLTHSTVDLNGNITLQGATDHSGIIVTVNPGGLTATTDTRGDFVISGLTCGDAYTIEATHSNYADLNDNFTATAPTTTYSGSLTACRNITGFTVTDSTEQVVLTWSAQAGATSYDIYRDGSLVTTVTGTTYTDSDVTFGTDYTYNMVVHYPTCESALLTTGRSVHVVPAIPTERFLVLDFDNGLTSGGTGLSDQVVTWIRELAGAGTVYVTAQNQNLEAFGQAWLNHFDMVYIITAINGASTDYFDDATATMLNTYAGVAGKKIVWEGASAATDITTGPYAGLRPFFNQFHATRVSAGHPAATGNIQNIWLDYTTFATRAVFTYPYQTSVDNLNDVIGTSGTATPIIWSDAAHSIVRGVKYNNFVFTSFYTAPTTQSAAYLHNGRRIVGQYLCMWFGICTEAPTFEGPVAQVNEPTLYQNSPNPFVDQTTIRFAVPTSGPAKLDVYTVTGEHVASLADETFDAGTYSLNWYSGELNSGIYLYRLTTAAGSAVRSMTIAK